jgi:hypothetical protein
MGVSKVVRLDKGTVEVLYVEAENFIFSLLSVMQKITA